MTRPSISDLARHELDAIIERYTLLIELYKDVQPPADLNGASYTAGFHAGVRSAYADAVKSIRQALA